jgi:hypothetical protein
MSNTEPFCNHDAAAVTDGVCECGYVLEEPVLMTTFQLTIECDNAAFEDAGTKFEVARILEKLSRKLNAYGPDAGTLADANGNTVGSFAFLPEPR